MSHFWGVKGGSVGKKLCVESIELVEFYLEPVSVQMEPGTGESGQDILKY